MEIPLSFQELCDSEQICEYCHWFDYGESKSSSHPDYGCVMCDGSRCVDSYEEYLDNFGFTETIVSSCNNVKLINEEEVSEWIRK